MIVHGEPLRRLVDGILQALGTPADIAAEVATHLVRADLSGSDAHGVTRALYYVAQADAGELTPASRPRLVREAPATAVFDAGRGFGHYAAAVATDWCLARAPAHGLAAAAVRARDVGRLAEYAERAAGAGLVAIAAAGSAGPDSGETMLFGGRVRFLGPNPWAIGVPGRELSLAFDVSTSTVSAADVLLARARDEELPAGSVYDRFGRPSTDPADFAAGGGLMPLGGLVAAHKGAAFALGSALLGGLALDGRAGSGSLGGLLLIVIDPAAFGTDYRDRVDATLAAARSSRPAPGHTEVRLPGEAEARARAERARTGIRLPAPTWAGLTGLAERFSVPLPQEHGG
jgi:uncharacterized oxidoreductase